MINNKLLLLEWSQVLIVCRIESHCCTSIIDSGWMDVLLCWMKWGSWYLVLVSSIAASSIMYTMINGMKCESDPNSRRRRNKNRKIRWKFFATTSSIAFLLLFPSFSLSLSISVSLISWTCDAYEREQPNESIYCIYLLYGVPDSFEIR